MFAQAACAHSDRVAEARKAVNLRKYRYFSNQLSVCSEDRATAGTTSAALLPARVAAPNPLPAWPR